MSSEPFCIVETSPNGRYQRYDEKLGEGSSKKVWKAFDTEDGRIVAWNCAKYEPLDSEDESKVKNEILILKTLRHPHIITLYDFWHDPKNHRFCFITDIMTDGTLRDFMGKVGQVNLSVIKNWSRQILSALHYLHSRSPPVIHRDLKCYNIFVSSATGTIRIGDFGLSALKEDDYLSGMVGTPEFMAPEIFNERYTEKVDTYAFGMCLLEMVTGVTPYEECLNNPYKVWKAIKNGVKPQSLGHIKDLTVASIIEICLQDEVQRPTAEDLIAMPFFHTLCPEDSNPVELEALIPNERPVSPQAGTEPLSPDTLSPDTLSPDTLSPNALSQPEPDPKTQQREQEAQRLEEKILANWSL